MGMTARERLIGLLRVQFPRKIAWELSSLIVEACAEVADSSCMAGEYCSGCPWHSVGRSIRACLKEATDAR